MPIQETGKEYCCETRNYRLRIRISKSYNKQYKFTVYQEQKACDFTYEQEVYNSDFYSTIGHCEIEMHNFISTNYNIL